MSGLPPFDDPRELVGDAMRAARSRFGLSQRELATRIGWSHSKLARWEVGLGPAALVAVQGVLRLLGYALLVVPIEDPQVPDDAPPDHIVDRGGRRFPAHLPAGVVSDPYVKTYWWTRYQCVPNPDAPNWTYRKR